MEEHAMENGTKKAVILHYAGIAAQTLAEADQSKLAYIREEMSEIEKSLGLTREEIILEARQILVPEA